MNRRLMTIGGGVLLAVLLAWYLLLWSPKANQLSAADKRTSAAQTQLELVQAQLVQAKSAQQREPQLRATLQRLHAAVPDKADLADFILAADDAGRRSGVELLTISPVKQKTSTTPGAPPEVGMTLTFTAGYGPTLDFVQRLLDLPRVFVIDSLQLGGSGGDAVGASGPLTVTIGGRMFTTQPEASAVVTTPPSTPTTTAVKP